MVIPTFRMHQVYENTQYPSLWAYNFGNLHTRMFMTISIKLWYFYHAPCRPDLSAQDPARPLDVPGSIKGFSVCVLAFIILPFPSYLDHLAFSATRFGSPIPTLNAIRFSVEFSRLRRYCFNPVFCIDLWFDIIMLLLVLYNWILLLSEMFCKWPVSPMLGLDSGFPVAGPCLSSIQVSPWQGPLIKYLPALG